LHIDIAAGLAYASGVRDLFSQYFEYIVAGAGVTLLLTISSVGIGMIFGTLIALGRLSRLPVLRYAASAYITFFRGTPLLVQLLLVYMGLPFLLGTSIERWPAAIAALSMNSAAYIAEIVRAGIQSIERGQREAGLAIGLRPRQVMTLIILPQAFRRIIPPLGNEFIAMLKDSSLVSVIALEELLRRSQIVVTRTFRPIEVYGLTALLYLLMTSIIAHLVGRVERRLSVEGYGTDKAVKQAQAAAAASANPT
jgi:glutamine transport system permease protein